MSVTTRRDAASIREEWLSVALSTEPADRPETEAAITGLYRLNGLPPPSFHWVSSPPRFSPGALTQLFGVRRRKLISDLDAAIVVTQRRREQVRRQVVRPLDRSRLPFRLIVYDHDRAWRDVHDVSWPAYYDCLPWAPGVDGIDLWDRAARAGGWWVPYREVCVVVDRPAVVHNQPGPGDGEVVVHRDDGPAVVYRDGRTAYAWRGLRVPRWVIEEPTAERIGNESDPEVRLAAIQRMGWPEYLDRTAARLMAIAPDPGNDAELRLYDARDHRVLVVVNGTVERDGTRRRYGLTVPEYVADPVEAAAWTYGITAPLYEQLVRRT
ncbi:DUF6745 domain-containing protein [Herbidospora cretacea]|uniref:DUF6745 domain-containing protein n=1 Tax=Herbidospora cretacea TaxID=28444 RepID=UPI00068B805C|nr:hypothetical protein [Herbidospora cretacea]